MKSVFRFPPWRGWAVLFVIFSIFSCQTGSKETDSVTIVTLLTTDEMAVLGDSLAALTQKTLLQNVNGAIAVGGPAHAVDYCNLRAIPLTDSIGGSHAVTIQRVTDKPRNPANALTGKAETELFDLVRSDQQEGSLKPRYFLENEHGQTVYYKPLVLGMPACLQCHGQPGKDIAVATMEKIQKKYPDDLATGYTQGELRGMWKISFVGK